MKDERKAGRSISSLKSTKLAKSGCLDIKIAINGRFTITPPMIIVNFDVSVALNASSLLHYYTVSP